MNEKKIEYLPPFKKFCMSIGALPSSFFESMSYYESMVWLYEYLKNNIVDVVNNNSEVTEELQQAFIQLENYIEHYFDDLDLQEEVDKKLDEMATDGTLADMIAEYIKMQGQLVYNSVSEMKQAENIQNGSFLKTYGFYSYNDGGGTLYKARTITNEDVIDDLSIIALHDNTLVAELINNNIEINVKQFGAKGDGNHDDTNNIQAAIDYAINNNLTVLINSTNEFYKVTKPLKVLVNVGVNGYWSGKGISIIGENKATTRIVKIGNYVYTEETETEFNNKNCTMIMIHNGTIGEDGTGVTLDNITLENYLNSELETNNTCYGLYTNVSRSTYKNLNIKSYKGINSRCFSCLFENILFMCTEEAFYLENGTSNLFRFMYCSGVNNPYTIRSSYSTIMNVCGDGITGTLFKISGNATSFINCGTESPNLKYAFEILSTFTGIIIDNFYMFRQIGLDNNETDIDQCAIIKLSAVNARVNITNLNIIETKHLTNSSYIYEVPTGGNAYLYSELNNITYVKNYDGTKNEHLLYSKNRPAVFSPQNIKTNSFNVNSFMTTNQKIYPFIGGYYDSDNYGVSGLNSNNISYMKSIWLDCKDKYHNENGDDIRYTGYHNKGDVQLYNDPQSMNALGLSITAVASRDSWTGTPIPIILTGTTTNRPTTNLYSGLQYFDTTLNKPIWYNGSTWVDSSGTSA